MTKKHSLKQNIAQRGKNPKTAHGHGPRGSDPPQVVRCNPALLAPNNSYGPMFVLRGYYTDTAFFCIDCGKKEIWTATRQKWWYEVAKGNVNATAQRCRTCRDTERQRKIEARRVHLEGIAGKRRSSA